MANPDDIIINVQVNGLNSLNNLSSGLRNITAGLQNAANLTTRMDAQQRSLDLALGKTSKGLNNHAKNLATVISNQAALGQEMRRASSDLRNLTSVQSSLNNQFQRSNIIINNAIRDMEKYSRALKGIKARALVEDLKSVSLEMKRLGKDAQFTGRSMIIGITTPLITFGRIGLASLVALDTQLVRLNKVIEYIAPNIEDAARKMGTSLDQMTADQRAIAESMVSEFNRLDRTLLDVSKKFGVTRELIVSIAGDFAELGSESLNTTISLTRLTAEAEKLGNLDIGASRAFIQSMYQQANRAIGINAQSMGKLVSITERETKAVAAVNAQLAMFNAIENATALSLKDLADAFPEMAAASTSFGLSMTEAAALLAPMVAAGFEVGASANSIKVSLQRLNSPTKQNMEMMQALANIMGGEFLDATSLGIDALDYLAQAFNKLQDSSYGAEGALEFMSNLFGVRQGPRMEVAIQELGFLNKALEQGVATAEGTLARTANEVIRLRNETTNSRVPMIRTFGDIGKIARIASAEVGQEIEIIDQFGQAAVIRVSRSDINAAKEARRAVGDQILAARREGVDLLGRITTQAGKAMFVELAGAGSAQEIATQELDAALNSLDTTIQRIKINFKLFASEFIKSISPLLDTISELVDKFVEFYTNLSPATKGMITMSAIGIAAMGPLVFAFGQARLAVATVANSLLKFLPGLSSITIESLSASKGLLYLNNPVVKVGDAFQTSASRLSLFIARLASMPGPIGKVAKSIGQMTGVLNKNMTAAQDVTSLLTATTTRSQGILNIADLAGIGTAGGTTGAIPSALGALAPKTGAELYQSFFDDVARQAAGADFVQTYKNAIGSAMQATAQVTESVATTAAASVDDLKRTIFGGPLALPAGKPMLALPAAGQTSTASKWPTVTRSQVFGPDALRPHEFTQRMQTAVISRTPMENIVPPMPTSVGMQTQTARNLGNIASDQMQAQIRGAEANAARRLTKEAESVNAKAYAAARRARKAAQTAAIKASVAQSVIPDMVPPDVLPFNKRRGSFISQLFGVGQGVGGAPSAASRRFVDQAILAEQQRISGSRIRRGLRRGLRGDILGGFMPPSIVQALPFDDEVTTGFLQRKYTGSRVIDRARAGLSRLTSAAKRSASKASGAISSTVTSFIDFNKNSFSTVSNGISGAFNTGSIRAKSALNSLASKSKSAFTYISGQASIVGNSITQAFAPKAAIVADFAKNAYTYIKDFAVRSVTAIFSITTAVKALKVAMISTGILAIIIGITAAVIFLVKNIDKLNTAGGNVGKKLGEALGYIKNAASAIIKPFKDTVGTLLKMATGAESTGVALGKVADWIKSAAKSISDFVEKYVVPVIKTVLENVIVIIQTVVNLIRSLIALFKGDWGDFGKYFMKVVGYILKFFVNAFIKASEAVISIVFSLGNAIIDLITGAIAVAVDALGNLIGNVVSLGGLIPGMKDLVSAGTDWLTSKLYEVEKPLDGIKNKSLEAARIFSTSFNEAIDDLMGTVSQGIIEGAGDDLIRSGGELGRELAEVITDPFGNSLDQVLNDAGSAAQDIIKDLKQNFVDKVLDAVGSSMKDAVDQLTNALEKQKDSALAVFDSQIDALNKLEKAEESLTKEQEYQADRRRMIQERELQVINYQRNRALAIYEGRIDDARMLSLEEQSNVIKFNDDLQKVDTNRRRDLAKENLETLKQSIEKAQEEASKFYDQQIEEFQKASAEITKFPPLTIEEYQSQLSQLTDVARNIAGENGQVLQEMMTSMRERLRMPNENVGVFTTGLDQLVSVARERYGLLDNANENTIIGATIGMIAGISGQFEGNRESIAASFQNIVSDVFDVSTGFGNIATDVISPALDAIKNIFETNNPFEVFYQAMVDANEAIAREFAKTVGGFGSLVDGLGSMIDQAILKLGVLNAALSGGGAGGAGGAGGLGGSDSGLLALTQGGTGARGGGDFQTFLNRNAWNAVGNLTELTSDQKMEAYNLVREAYKAYNAGTLSYGAITEFYRGQRDPVGRAVNRAFIDVYRNMPTYFGGQTSIRIGQPRLVEERDGGFGGGGGGSFRYGGRVKKFAIGGYAVPGSMSQAIPALLHGGEYVVNANAVRNIGYATLQSLNNMRFKQPARQSYDTGVSSTNVSTTNIYVDTFVGEDKWFQEMLKKYNMNVLPNNQKSAGMENRVITSYSGLSRGM